MSQKKRRNFNRILLTAGTLLSCAFSFITPPPTVSAHHPSNCSDVFTPLSSFVIDGVNRDRSAYERVQNETGVPWEMLAAIHYRETSFSHTNPGNGQGIFQFVGGAGGPYPPGPVNDDEFYRQLKFMANKLQDDYVWRGSIPRERRRLQPGESNITLVKDTLFSYNGRAGVYADQAGHFGYNASLQPYEGSPYVVNRFDCPRARMGLITQDYGSMDGIDARYGAFTVFARLRGDNYWRSISSSPFGSSFVLAKSDDSNDLRQWVLYGNIKQHVPNSQILFAWGLQNVPLVTTSVETLNSIPTGPNLGRLLVLNDGSPTIFFVDNGTRYKIPWMTMFNVWNFPGQVISGVSPGLFALPADGGNLSFAVKNPANNTKYMLDGRNGSGQTVLRPYQDDAVMTAWEGSASNFTTLSSDYFDSIDDAIGPVLTGTKVRYGSSLFMISNNTRIPVNAPVMALYPGAEQFVSGATFERLPYAYQWATQLIKSTSGPTVYLVDGGQKHQILWPDALTAWSVPGQTITAVNDSFIGLIPNGPSIGGYKAETGGSLYLIDHVKTPVPTALDGAYRGSGGIFNASATLLSLYPTSGGTLKGIVRSASSPAVHLLDSSGKRRHLEWADKVSAWGGYTTGVTMLSDYIINSMGTTISPLTFVNNGTTDYLLDDGKKWTVSPVIKTAWGLGSPQVFTDGTLDRLPAGGALETKLRDGQGGYFLITGGSAYGTTDANIAQMWGIENAPIMSARAVPANLPVFMLTRLVRSNVNGDNRTFVIDGGNWYNLPSNQLANMSAPGSPVMQLNPSLAPNAPTDWQSVVVKSASGAHFVIDSGGKRFFNNATIQNHWTANGTITVPVVTDGFLNSLPTRGFIERTIKGNSPQIYFYENGTKRLIRFSDTYHQNYAPFMFVSDQLITVLPDGAPI